MSESQKTFVFCDYYIDPAVKFLVFLHQTINKLMTKSQNTQRDITLLANKSQDYPLSISSKKVEKSLVLGYYAPTSIHFQLSASTKI